VLPPTNSRFREGADLIAEMSLLRNHPKPTEWWVALVVVQPESRGRGRRDHTSQTGVHRRVITMRRALTPTR
jgi:hypothetical protein